MKLVPSASGHRPKPPEQAKASAGKDKGQPATNAGPTSDKFLIVTISAAISITIVSIIGLVVLKGVIAAATPYVVIASGIVGAGAVIGLILRHKNATVIRALEQQVEILSTTEASLRANLDDRNTEIASLEEKLNQARPDDEQPSESGAPSSAMNGRIRDSEGSRENHTLSQDLAQYIDLAVPAAPPPRSGQVINMGSTFPLTLYGGSEASVEEIAQLLKQSETVDRNEVNLKIQSIIGRSGIRCLEIDQYIRNYKPTLIKEIKARIESSKEWETAPDEDREMIISDAAEEAMSALQVRFDDAHSLLTENPSAPESLHAMASVLLHTYWAAEYASRMREEIRDPDLSELFSGSRFQSAGDVDTCDECKRYDGREFQDWPTEFTIPLHIGCRCSVTFTEF